MRPGPVTPLRSAIHRSLCAAALGLMLLGASACVRFGAKPPQRLLGIATESRVKPGLDVSNVGNPAIFVETPHVPKSIATQRVAVRASDTSYAYVKDALWVDLPANQFQALLSETIAAKTGLLVLDPGQYPAQLGRRLQGSLLDFGIDAAGEEAVVTYEASLLSADGRTVQRQRFSAHAPVNDIDADSVAPAVSTAANEVAAAVAEWVRTLP